jgi:tetratricopeptide (TPR) repeat protein
VRQLALAGLAGWVGLSLAVGPASADPGSGDALPQLMRALAAAEAKEGKTSPYLLPVIEEIAQLRLRNGELSEAAALRRRALDIAVTRFGAASQSAAEAMVALAQIAIDRRHYLDAEPLLIVADTVLRERVDADHPAMAAIFAGLARIALARGEISEAKASAERAVAIARRNPHGRSTEPLRVLGAVLASE